MDTTRRDASTITQVVRGQHVATTGDLNPVSAKLTYDTTDPFAVTVVFRLAAASPVTWIFARDLLTEGLTEPIGDGDVHIWPSINAARASVVMLDLSVPGGDALVELPSGEVRAFVVRMHDCVAPGEESAHLDIDAAIAAVRAAEHA